MNIKYRIVVETRKNGTKIYTPQTKYEPLDWKNLIPISSYRQSNFDTYEQALQQIDANREYQQRLAELTVVSTEYLYV